jgi:hypothetical protein
LETTMQCHDPVDGRLLNHTAGGAARFRGFVRWDGSHFESTRPITVEEFNVNAYKVFHDWLCAQ